MHERMMDKSNQPTEAEMIDTIGQPISEAWTALRRFLVETYDIAPVYNSGGKKYGWNLQYRFKGRPLCEIYPEHGSFTVLVILGNSELKQAQQMLESFGPMIQKAILETPRYHDGSWMYIRVEDGSTCLKAVEDIEQLILIKRKPQKAQLS